MTKTRAFLAAIAAAIIAFVAVPQLRHAAAQQAIGAYANFRNQGTNPATPPAGFVRVFTKTSDKRPYSIDDTGAVTSLSGGGGAGTVTSVDCGTGLTCTPDPIVGAGTVVLANTAVSPASYTLMSGTVDAQGRLTAASNGTAVTSLTCGTGLSGGVVTTTGTCSMPNTGPGAGTVGGGGNCIESVTLDAQGRATAVAATACGGSSTFATTYSATPANNIVPVDATGGEVIYKRTDVAVAELPALGVENDTVATSGNQKDSPLVKWCGVQFVTGGTGSQVFCYGIKTEPIQDSAGRANFVIYFKVGAGAWTKYLEFTYDPVSTVHKMQANVGIFQILNSAGTGISPQSNDLYIYNANAASLELTNGAALSPFTDGARTLGYDAKRWGAVRTWWVETKRGAQLTAAASITPTTGFHHVTGATTIDTIATTNVPSSGNATLQVAADGGTITWSAAGNILSAGTIAQDKMQIFMYDGTATKWIPQQ